MSGRAPCRRSGEQTKGKERKHVKDYVDAPQLREGVRARGGGRRHWRLAGGLHAGCGGAAGRNRSQQHRRPGQDEDLVPRLHPDVPGHRVFERRRGGQAGGRSRGAGEPRLAVHQGPEPAEHHVQPSPRAAPASARGRARREQVGGHQLGRGHRGGGHPHPRRHREVRQLLVHGVGGRRRVLLVHERHDHPHGHGLAHRHRAGLRAVLPAPLGALEAVLRRQRPVGGRQRRAGDLPHRRGQQGRSGGRVGRPAFRFRDGRVGPRHGRAARQGREGRWWWTPTSRPTP